MADLQNELQAAQDEMAEYKQEVFGQFAQTAEHFRDLDKSYHALHSHLAASSVALCGDQATPLLAHNEDLDAPESEADGEVVEGSLDENADSPEQSANDSQVEEVVAEENSADEVLNEAPG